jgi:hypothetical protein
MGHHEPLRITGTRNGFFVEFVEKTTDSDPAQSLLTPWMNLSA